MNTIQITPEKKQIVKDVYAGLCGNLNAILTAMKVHLPDAGHITVIDMLQDAGKREEKALAFLNRQYAAANLPAGLNINNAIENKLIDLPDWKPVMFPWGNAMSTLNQFKLNHFSRGTNFHYPLIHLFDSGVGEFTLTQDFLTQLDHFFSLNIEQPKNMDLINELVDLLNKFSEAGAWEKLHSNEQLRQLMDLFLVKNGKFMLSSSFHNSGIASQMLQIKRKKHLYTAENYLTK